MNTKVTGAAKDTTEAGVAQPFTGMSQEQLQTLMREISPTIGLVAAQAAQAAAADFVAKARPEIENRTTEQVTKAVAEAMARKEKTSTLVNYGKQAAVSAGVFVAGTLAMIGVDKFRHRNDSRANEMNPQYHGSNT